MIRFIDLGDQLLEGTPMFAWYDTVVDSFERYNDSEAWETWSEFQNDYLVEKGYSPKSRSLDRYKRLFPKHWTIDKGTSK